MSSLKTYQLLPPSNYTFTLPSWWVLSLAYYNFLCTKINISELSHCHIQASSQHMGWGWCDPYKVVQGGKLRKGPYSVSTLHSSTHSSGLQQCHIFVTFCHTLSHHVTHLTTWTPADSMDSSRLHGLQQTPWTPADSMDSSRLHGLQQTPWTHGLWWTLFHCMLQY